jgi:hypothetical protein
MLIQHQHEPEECDSGHCRTCARQARRYALWALCSSRGGILLAAVALLTR